MTHSYYLEKKNPQLKAKVKPVAYSYTNSLALLYREVLERLRRIEEYIAYMDTDIHRLRLEVQRLASRVEDLTTQLGRPPEIKPAATPMPAPPSIPREKPLPETAEAMPTPAPQLEAPKPRRRGGLSETEIMILKYLAEHPGTRSATPIASAIGKAREHVARTLKKLTEKGYIRRDETTWPYTYELTEEARQLLSRTAGST
ncbi:MAG: winged helix-turn-helix transcriptional regulator [Candidatus Verstraetearchaeota archaeon]|nr:winged helix-turn-helix transcriptional regulator [Candidatus Verstraetearchaeota archaeon]